MNRDEALKILGLSFVATIDKSDVESSFRKAALDAHPDRGGAAEMFLRISAAKDLLLSELLAEPLQVEKATAGATTSPVVPATKYDEPGTQSTDSPLRKMGKPLDLKTIDPEVLSELWFSGNLQCVWRCECCDAVCCRVRADKFSCICGHQLRCSPFFQS
jgi:hypothetical protein